MVWQKGLLATLQPYFMPSYCNFLNVSLPSVLAKQSLPRSQRKIVMHLNDGTPLRSVLAPLLINMVIAKYSKRDTPAPHILYVCKSLPLTET